MPERLSFSPEIPPTPLEAAAEKAAFLDAEKEERRQELIQAAKKAAEEAKDKQSKKRHLEEAKNWEEKSDDEMYTILINNLPLWLPRIEEGGTFGAYRTEDMVEMRKEEMPEKHEASLILIKDIDEYLDQNGLRERAKQIAQQSARNQKLMSKASQQAFEKNDPSILRDLVLDDTISEKEILEFKKDLYYAMRKRGHSGLELRT